MSKSIDTGDNGFPLNGQKQTYDVGIPDNEAVSKTGPGYGTYQQGVDVSEGYQDSNGNPKDLSTPTKTTLAQYLSKLTMGQEGAALGNAPPIGNVYPVGDGTPTLNTISTTDPKGYPAALEDPIKNPATFAGTAEQQIDYPTQQYPAIQQLIKKGLSSANAVDGNDLLPGVTGTSTSVASNPSSLVGDAPQTKTTSIPGRADTSAKIINPYTSAVLSQNRFTSANAAFAAVSDVTDPGPNYDPSLTVQGKMGEWDASGTQSKSYNMGRLATIGPLLGLRATTTLGATSPGADPNSGGMEAAALLPGLAQLGTATIDQHVLQAADILSSLTNDDVTGGPNYISPGSQSWGQLNDTNDPYDGTNALGMVTLTLALVAGVQVVLGALGILLGMVTPQTKVSQRDSTGRYAVGQYFPASKPPNAVSGGGPLGAISAIASLNFGALLGINPTVYPLSQAMNSGLAAFYGLPQPSGGPGFSFNVGLSTATDSPGFLVNVSRSIIRGFVVIGQSLSKIGGNPMNVINAILSMIDTIRSSKVVAAINVWSMLGDQILTIPKSDTDSSAVGGTKFSTVDEVNDGLSTAMSKNRLQNTLKLAWASNRSRANLLVPTSIVTAAGAVTGLGQFDYFSAGPDAHSLLQFTPVQASDNGRIDSKTAATMESQLESEYVPFYFHDIRTNEMVGFHAFLASLNDDYQAAYEKTEGYGRVEPVKIYKGTERRIGMSFYIAATSEADFDDMWLKINKLVTLVYPQYTKGVQLSNGSSYAFTQPFSQLIGASPLIRIRLGNLLTSNYSQFALARLFGLGNPEFTINSYTTTGDANTIISSYQTSLQDALSSPNGESYLVAPGSYPLYQAPSNGPSISVSIGGPPGPSFAPVFEPHKAPIAGLFMVNASQLANSSPVSQNDPGPLVCTVAVNDDPKFALTYGTGAAGAKSPISAATDEYNNSDKLIRQVIGGQYVIPAKALIPTNKTKTGIIANLDLSSTGADDLSSFMSPTNNAVAKSFADTGGKGLAGFIETMSFDWYDKVTWELHDGRVAPKLCKVTIAFSPIHDISPGIDHFGYNRAPVYPVGPFAPGFVPPTS